MLWRADIQSGSSVVRNFLVEIATNFNSDRIAIDIMSHNPSRIVKIYGTIDRKHVPVFAKFLRIPEKLTVVREVDIVKFYSHDNHDSCTV